MKKAPLKMISRVTLIAFSITVPATLTTVSAQTLEEEYRRYLDKPNSCSAMNFDRDGSGNVVLPGQASAALSLYCLRTMTGPSVFGTIGGNAPGANSAVGESGTQENPALRRRREAARDKRNGDTSHANALSVPLATNIGAFFSVDYRRHERDSTYYAGGREGEQYLATLGADYRFGGTGMMGIAFKGEKLAGDLLPKGEFESRGGGLMLFGSWFPAEGMFLDVSLAANRKTLDSRRFVSLTRVLKHIVFEQYQYVTDIAEASADSEVDSMEWGGDLRSGYDFNMGRITFGPRVGVAYQRSEIDAYAEQGDTIMKLAFDKQTEDSLRSIVGLQASAAFTVGGTVLAPQLNGEWLHEFRNDQRYITARFVDDYRPNPTRLRFQNEAPDRDVYLGRFSMVAVFQGGISAFLSAEKLFGHDYQDHYGGSLGVRMEF